MIWEILRTSCVPKLVICLLLLALRARLRLAAAARGGGRIGGGGHLAAAELHHTAAANAAADGDLKVPSTKPIRPGRGAGERKGRWMEMEQNSFSKALTPSRNRRRHKSELVSRQKIDRSFWVGLQFFIEQVSLKL